MSLNCLGQTCLAPSLKLAHRLQKKKSKGRRVGWNALQGVLSRLFLRVGCSLFYIAGFCHISGSFPVLFSGDAETIPGMSGTEEVSTGVETDGQLRGRHIVVTRSLVPLAGGPQHDVPEAVHSRGRSRELLERAFDDGNSCVWMRNLLVLFQVGSKFLPCLFLSQISSWPIPLPLWFVPLGIKWCPSVAPCANRRRLSCCLFWWTVRIFRLLSSVVLFFGQ